MEILRYFTPSEPIAGLEISEDALRLVLLHQEKICEHPPEVVAPNQKPNQKQPAKKLFKFRFKKCRPETKVICAVEEPLSAGTVEDGMLKNPQAFAVCLSSLLKKAKTPIQYAIVTFSNSRVYSKLYGFPDFMDDEKIGSTMRLTTEYQLPIKPDKFYLDWEKYKSTQKKEVLLAATPRVDVEAFKKALHAAGVQVVAVELSPISVARIFDEAASKNPIMLIIKNTENFSISILKRGLVHFNRTLSAAFCKSSSLPEEARKIVDFYEAEYKEKVEQIFLIGEKVVAKKTKKTEWPLPISEAETAAVLPKGLVEGSVFLPALGAATRGIIPRSEDNHLSLMSIGTETAYETQKALVFAGFLSNLIVGFSVLIAAIFIGSWILTVSLQKSISSQIANLSANPVPGGGVEIMNKATQLNIALQDEGAILRTIPRWSMVFENLKNNVGQGISISSSQFPSIDGNYSFTGAAVDRQTLRDFKKTLEDSSIFSVVDLPISNISEKNNIPFSLTLRLKDVKAVYYR